MLRRLGLAEKMDAMANPIKHGVRVFGTNATNSWYVKVSSRDQNWKLSDSTTWQVRRSEFDAMMFKEARCRLKLNLCATNVRTGKIKVFSNREITPDAVMASACLPFLFQAVEIDGEAYWDGGYMGNPAIFPLIYGCESPDVLIVHINPMKRPDVPATANEILNRINEISFNSSLMREMRAIDFVTKLIDLDMGKSLNLKRMYVHAISSDEVMVGLSAASKLNADWAFLTDLRDSGRERAGQWLEQNFERIGKQSSVDIQASYL